MIGAVYFPANVSQQTSESELLGVCFFSSFLYFFVSVPCARLSWPSRQVLSARESTVSYRIITYRSRMTLGFDEFSVVSRSQ